VKVVTSFCVGATPILFVFYRLSTNTYLLHNVLVLAVITTNYITLRSRIFREQLILTYVFKKTSHGMVLKFRYIIHKRLMFMKEASLHSVVMTSSQDREHTPAYRLLQLLCTYSPLYSKH
jgi:hypothetical protein